MKLELFNDLLSNVKENNFFQKFITELSNYFKKEQKANCLYQVVSIDVDGVYLQNTNNNKVLKETDISKEILGKIGIDYILQYKDGKYVYEEELTQKFFDSLIDIKEYRKIKDDFIKKSNILEIDSSVIYKIEKSEDDFCILSYGDSEERRIEVPRELIPFWAKNGQNLYYKNGEFNRVL